MMSTHKFISTIGTKTCDACGTGKESKQHRRRPARDTSRAGRGAKAPKAPWASPPARGAASGAGPNPSSPSEAAPASEALSETVTGRFSAAGSPQTVDKTVLTSTPDAVNSSSPSPMAANSGASSAETETVNQPSVARQQESVMKIDLVRSKVNPKGRYASYTAPGLKRSVVLMKGLFEGGVFPESISIEGEGFATKGAEEVERERVRAEKRAAKGLKPLPTPQERAEKLAASVAKAEARLAKQKAAQEKLAAKLAGTAASAAV